MALIEVDFRVDFDRILGLVMGGDQSIGRVDLVGLVVRGS